MKKKTNTRSKSVARKVLIAVLISAAASLMLGLGISFALRARPAPEDTETVDTDADYDASAGVIDAGEYNGTVLEDTEDAGKDYIDSTLFLGDSNTARFTRFLSDDDKTTFTTKNNTIGVVGMGIDAISSLPCMQFSTGTFTMPKSVAVLQPERVIIMFGTNNLYGTSTDAASFIERYTKQIQSIEDAYPSVDIIVAAIPPVSKVRDYVNVSMTQIDAYNKAIVKMCEDNDWKFLNTAEALKDETTGFAKEGVMDKDGLHLSRQGLITLFSYIRTHAWETEDDRPKPLASIPNVIGVVPDLIKVNPLNDEEFTEDVLPEETTDTSGETYTVPNVSTLGELKSWAADKNIMIVTTPSNAANNRKISSMDPAMGSTIKAGQTIKVTLQAAETVTVPEFSSKEEAVTWGRNNGVNISVVTEENADLANGTVVRQSVAAGSVIEKGRTITVTIVQNPESAHTHEYTILVKTIKEPTCTEEGSAEYRCSCGETAVLTVEKLTEGCSTDTPSPSPSTSSSPSPTPSDSPSPSPTPSDSPTPTPTHVHSYTGTVTTPATCTSAGVMTYTCSCGESYTESIPALTEGCSTPDPSPSVEPSTEPSPTPTGETTPEEAGNG